MSTFRTGVGVVGVAALALAAGTVFAPDVAFGRDVVARFGNDYLFVVPIALTMVVVVVGVIGSRSIRGIHQTDPPAPEGVPTGDDPGDDFDRLVDGGWRTAISAHRQCDQLRDRLQETAIRTVMRTERCSRDAARQRVEAGTWTGDEVAATFLTTDRTSGQITTRVAVAALRRREVPLQWRARRAALAIDRAGREEPA